MQGNNWYDCGRVARSKRRPARAFRPAWISHELEIRAVPATLTLSPTTLPDDTIGTAYNQGVSASGGTAPYMFAVTTGTLPGGLTLDPNTGAITGTPNATGTSSFTITATDNASDSGSQNYSVTINPALTFTTTTLPGATVNTAYNQQLATTGGTGTPTFAVTTGNLPTGLTLNPNTGAITGTPTTTGNSSFTVTATDTAGATASQQFSNFAVNATPAITTTTLPGATAGAVYNQQLATSGGTTPFTFAVTTGNLPTGLILNPNTGAITGTPITAGTSTFTVTATDNNGATASQQFSNFAVNPVLAFTTTTLPGATVNTAYSQQLATTGGTGTPTFAVTTGNLPTGLTLNPNTGAITGTPTTTGNSSFTVTATDTAGATASQQFSNFAVNATPAITTTTLPGATVNTAYNQQLATSGGTTPFTFAVTTGNLPTGLTLNPNTGAITGTPTTAGTSTFTVTATDNNGATASQQFSNFAVNPALAFTTTTLPQATINTGYMQQLATTGGTGASTFAVTTGNLPAGLTLTPAGMLSGTPTAAGTSTFTVTATDTAGATADQPFSFTVNPALAFTTTTLPNGTVGTAYSQQQLQVSGGTAPFTFAVTNGTLPAGLTLSSAGVLSGTPTSTGTSTFTVTATDANNATATQDYTVTINQASAITISPSTLPDAIVGSPYFQQLLGTGGTGAITFAVTSGNLPAGLSLTPAGLLSGTPTTAGSSTFVVTGTDTNNNTGTQQYTINVNANSGFAFTTTTLPDAAVGAAYNQQLMTTGGTGTPTFAVTTGALPAGLTLSNAGLISGTPTAAGTSTFAITATDTAGATAVQNFTLNVTAAGTAPTVTGLQRFGFHDQPTIYVLSFSGPLNPASAQNISNYTLVPLVGGQPGAPIPLASAVYDPTSNTVTLNPAQLVYAYGQYQLTVNGTAPNGVQGASGAFLAGANGQPGTNFVQTFGMEILAGPNLPTGTTAAIAHRINNRWAHHIGPRFHLRTGAHPATNVNATAAIPRRRHVIVRTFHTMTAGSTGHARLALAARRAHAAAVDSALVAIVRARHKK